MSLDRLAAAMVLKSYQGTLIKDLLDLVDRSENQPKPEPTEQEWNRFLRDPQVTPE